MRSTILPPAPLQGLREAIHMDNFHLEVVAAGNEALRSALILAMRGYRRARAWSDHPELGL